MMHKEEYIDFNLVIHRAEGSTYLASVHTSGGGETDEKLIFPYDLAKLPAILTEVKNEACRGIDIPRSIRGQTPDVFLSPPAESTVRNLREFGQQLFQMLFKDSIRDIYQQCLGSGRGVRIKLSVRAPELAAVPWEFLFDPSKGDYLCLLVKTPLIRYPQLVAPIQPLTVAPPLRILGMVASPIPGPADTFPILNVQQEQQHVEQALEDLLRQDKVRLRWVPGQSIEQLMATLQDDGRWHMFHFIGHGMFNPYADTADQGALIFADEVTKRKRPVTGRQLGRQLFVHSANNLRLVLLNACEGAHANQSDLFSSSAGALVEEGIPGVVAMQYEISDRAATVFSRKFYQAIADGRPVDVAVTEARVGIQGENVATMEWASPVLYLRSSTAFLFDIPATKLPPVDSPIKNERVYLEAITAAWNHRTPNIVEIQALRNLATELGLAKDKAYANERIALSGMSMGEIYYRREVATTWRSRSMPTRTEIDRLRSLCTRLELGPQEADEIECSILGLPMAIKLAITSYEAYLMQVFAGNNLDQSMVDQLDRYARQLGLSRERTAAVERRVLGITKEAILQQVAMGRHRLSDIVRRARSAEKSSRTTRPLG